MHVSRCAKAIVGTLLATATALTATAMPASAHMSIVTTGTTFTAGATNVFYFRVPHGCADPDKTSGAQAFNARTTSTGRRLIRAGDSHRRRSDATSTGE